MSRVPGFTAEVFHNGTIRKFQSIKIKQDAKKVGVEWSVTFPKPITVTKDDIWKIILGVAGHKVTYVNGPARSYSGNNLPHQVTDTVEGIATDLLYLLEYCIPKTLCFINEPWLYDNWPGAVIRNGAVYAPTAKSYFMGTRGEGDGFERIYHYRLPGIEFKEGDFQCVLGPRTHRSISAYIANAAGFGFVSNVPDLDIADTYTVQSGTPFFDAIKANMMLWFPHVEVLVDEKGKPTIYVTDILKGDGFPRTPQTINLGKVALSSHNFKKQLRFDPRQIVDHVVVIGRVTKDTTTWIHQSEPPQMTAMEIPEIEVVADTVVIVSSSIDNRLDKAKREDCYTGMIGQAGKGGFNISKLRNEYRVHHYKKDVDPKTKAIKWIPVAEETFLYGYLGIVSKTVKNFYYGAGYKVIRTTEDEYSFGRLPGQSNPELNLIKVKTTFQDWFVKSLNLTLTAENIDEVVVHTRTTKGGQTIVSDPVPYSNIKQVDYSRDAIPKPKPGQRITTYWYWMTTHEKRTYINRVHDDLLMKIDQDYSTLPDVTKTQSQILQNPEKNMSASSESKDNQFRMEFWINAQGVVVTTPSAGNGAVIGTFGKCYHQPATVSHPDITTEEIAKALATRAFMRRGEPSYNVTVKSPVPLLVNSTMIRLGLPDLVWKEKGTTLTVPGGSYILTSIDTDVTVSDKELKCDQSITAATRY